MQINLLDVDEFPPKFGQPSYNAAISAKSPPTTSVLQLTASDGDDAEANFVFQEQSGDPKGDSRHVVS